jgi:hypothetical protein
MRPSTGYKLIGCLFIVPAVGATVLALFGESTGRPGLAGLLIGFFLYRRGMRLALQENEAPQQSIYFAMLTAWWRQLTRRQRGNE